MMEMVLQRKEQLKKQGKKGFTLVELIVVIVILGILAAIAVPALIGYIDKARTDGAITEAASARTAMQTIASDAYSKKGIYSYGAGPTKVTVFSDNTGTTTTVPTGLNAAIDNLIGASNGGYSVTAWSVEKGIVKTFTVKVPSGATVAMDANGVYTVTPAA